MSDEIKDYLAWRRKTRFIRRHGGLLLACGIIIATILLLWRRANERYSTAIDRKTSHQAPKLSTFPEKIGPRLAVAPNSATEASQPSIAKPPAKTEGAKETQSRDAMNRWKAAEVALQGFFGSESDEERLAWVSPSENAGERLQQYAAHFPVCAWFAKPERIGPQFALQDRYLITSVQFPGQRPRHIAIKDTAQGSRVDWESYVGFCEMSFREIAAASSMDKPVLVRAETYQVNPPPPGFDGKEYLALMLRHPDDGVALQALVKRADVNRTKAGRTLAANLPGRYTLRVQAVPGAAPSGWVVVPEVVCPGWVPELYASSAVPGDSER